MHGECTEKIARKCSSCGNWFCAINPDVKNSLCPKCEENKVGEKHE